MKIGLLGIGTVGKGVYQQLIGRDDLVVKKILDLRDIPELGDLMTKNYEDILNDAEIETVVELMGGMEPARTFVLQALRAGKNVVTANKLMLSYHFEELVHVATEHNVQLKIDASVGGGIPYLFNLTRASRADTITSVSGIVNGTTNLILDTMQTNNIDFDEVLAQAQRAGYAEADPSADIDGIDARSKLCISSMLAYRRYIHPEDIAVAGIRNITSEDVLNFKKLDYVCRFLVYSESMGNDKICAFVEPTLISPSAMEATVHHNDNLIGMVGRYAGEQYFFGQGAGQDPTAFAVVLGLTDILNGIAPFNGCYPQGRATIDNAHATHRYYVRTTARLGIAAEKLRSNGDSNVYITAPMPVDRMHALAASLLQRDPNLFFAGIRG